MQSESIAKLAEALSKAQGKITGALKDSANPFFKSKYADLASCWDACRTPLSENGLAVIQTTEADETGVVVVTTLAHTSGEWIRGTLRMTPVKSDPQGIGSCITYARRYALAGIVGIAQVDDDANAASQRGVDPRGELTADPAKVEQWVKDIKFFLKEYGSDENKTAEFVYASHVDLNKDQGLYIEVGDRLVRDKICSRAGWTKLKEMGKAQVKSNGT